MNARWADITGCGVVAGDRHTVADFSRAILGGESLIGPFVDDFRATSGMPEDQASLNLRYTKGAPVRDFDPKAHFDDRTLAGLDVFARYAAVAARQAWKESGLDLDPPKPSRVGVVIGSANGGQDVLSEGWRRLLLENRKPYPLTIPMTMANAAASRIAREITAHGLSLIHI